MKVKDVRGGKAPLPFARCPADRCFLVGLFLSGWLLALGPAVAQPPRTSLYLPDGIAVPDPPPTPHPRRAEELEAISRVIEGQAVGDPAAAEMVFEITGGVGSLMTGTALDPALDDATLETQVSPVSAFGTTSQPRIVRSAKWRAPGAEFTPSAHNRQYAAAELLLKTARLLDKIEPASENQRTLVNQMRLEAVRLLNETVEGGPAPILRPSRSPGAESAGPLPRLGQTPPPVRASQPAEPIRSDQPPGGSESGD